MGWYTLILSLSILNHSLNYTISSRPVSDESTYHTLHRWLEEISARNDSERRSSGAAGMGPSSVYGDHSIAGSPFFQSPPTMKTSERQQQYQYQHQHHILRTPPGSDTRPGRSAAYDARSGQRQRPVLLVSTPCRDAMLYQDSLSKETSDDYAICRLATKPTSSAQCSCGSWRRRVPTSC